MTPPCCIWTSPCRNERIAPNQKRQDLFFFSYGSGQVQKAICLSSLWQVINLGEFKKEKKDAEQQLLQELRPKQRVCYEAVRNRAFLDHLQSELTLGEVFSLPSTMLQGSQVLRLADARRPAGHARGDPGESECADLALASNLCPDDLETVRASARPGADIVPKHVFFKLLSSTASRLKTVKASAAGKRKVHKGDLAITIHAAISDPASKNYVLETQPSKCSDSGDLVRVFSSFGVSMADMSQMLKWRRSSEHVLSIPDMSADCGVALELLMRANAFEGRQPAQYLQGQDIEGTSLNTLRELCDAGYVSEHEQGWQLKTIALQRMSIGQRVMEPNALASVDELKPLSDCTTFELCLKLESLGWVWQRGDSKKTLPSYQQDALRVWYSSGVTVLREYLLCLAQSDEFFDTNPDFVVEHLQPVKYYRCLLDRDFVPGLRF